MTTTGDRFSYNPEDHTYRVNGKRLLSITQILSIAGMTDTTWYTAAAADKGSRIHTLTEKMDEGRLDIRSVDPPLQPYLEAYRAFKRDTGIRITAVEYPCYNLVYRIAGTIDRIALFRNTPAVIDIKTGSTAPWHPLQTAGYVLILDGDYERFNLYLSAGGTYRLIQHRDPLDTQVFIAALTVAYWNYETSRGKAGETGHSRR